MEEIRFEEIIKNFDNTIQILFTVFKLLSECSELKSRIERIEEKTYSLTKDSLLPSYGVDIKLDTFYRYCSYPHPRLIPVNEKIKRINVYGSRIEFETEGISALELRYNLAEISLKRLIELAYNIYRLGDVLISTLKKEKDELSNILEIMIEIATKTEILTKE